MRAIKSVHIGFLTRCFEFQRRFQLCVASIVGFRFDGSVRMMSEMAVWSLIGTELGDEAIIDEIMPKTRGEFFVRGKAYSPGGQPQITCPVKVKVGSVEKTIYVIGNRTWRDGVPTEPEPFTTMDLTWANAYGGAGYARNPAGKGFAPIQGEDKKPVHPLPNIETPGRLIRSPSDKREPAGLLPFGLDWPQRREKLGTYDDQWLKQDYPGFPRDLDWNAFNVSSPDQQHSERWVGDEEIVCTNLHPKKSEVRGRLPGLRTRCFLTFKGAIDPNALTEVPMRPTTVWLFPHLEVGILISHGVHPIDEDDGFDVEDMLLAAENLVGEGRSLEHYENARASYIKAEPEALLALVKGTDLVPPGCDGALEIGAEIAALSPQNLAGAALSRRAVEEFEAARAQLEAAGMDPSMLGPAPEVIEPGPPDLGKLTDQIEEGKKKIREGKRIAEEQATKAKEEARKFCEEHDLDFEKVVQREPGPPDYSAARVLGEIEGSLANSRLMGNPLPELEAMVADPEYRARVHASEAQVFETYRLSAHIEETKPGGVSEEQRAARRAELLRRVGAGESVSRGNWTAVDVSGENLAGADLSGGAFEQSNFSGCDLRGANLTETVFAGADLSGANLSAANFARANLGRANLTGATADAPPSVKEATLDYVDLTGARLGAIALERAIVRGAKLDRANLTGASLKNCTFLECSMAGVDFSRADLTESSLLDVDATGMVASHATLQEMNFHNCRVSEAKIDHAQATNLRTTGTTGFARSDFTESVLDKANFRDVDLSGAVFARAKLGRADLSGARLIRGNLEGIVAREALMIRTDFTDAKLVNADLMNALLSKANLTGTDLRNASLYGADLARAKSHRGTNLQGVNQTRARIHPALPPKAAT